MAAGIQQQRRTSRHRRAPRHSRHAAMSEINVTPFVDVILVLLIVFMVSAPLMTVGVPIELPETAAEALPGEQEEPLAVTLTVDGQMMIQSTVVPEAELVTRLQAIAAERDSTQIFLRADGAIPYQDVMRVMGALNAGGFRQIGLVTDAGGPRLDAPTGE
ncbi:ExbD/TolR family protein [Nioella nitratireducens]|uniref:ExbD/TolR family protein n=1 Tax=Nioella nitratireducens TaxID=1287720 RepID=UPI0008FD18B3